MEKRLSRWGVGPRIGRAAVLYAAAAGIATFLWPELCLVESVPYRLLAWIGGCFVAVGVVMLALAARAVMTAYNRDQLVTTGIAALVRHPIYSAWIMFILPGLVLFSASWPVFLTPVAAYMAFRRFIHTEDEYLTKHFGKSYLDYRQRVSELFPIPRFH